LHSFESTPAFLIFAGNGIFRASDAASALASSLVGLTALRILDLSGAHVLTAFSGRSHPPSDNDITGFSHQDPSSHYRSPDEIAAFFAPFLPSLARLHDLESLNLSGAHSSAML
jgi:hypothetical protein